MIIGGTRPVYNRMRANAKFVYKRAGKNSALQSIYSRLDTIQLLSNFLEFPSISHDFSVSISKSTI